MSFIKALILSELSSMGPICRASHFPADSNLSIGPEAMIALSIKSIALMAFDQLGESNFSCGFQQQPYEGRQLFGLIPFPDLDSLSLTLLFTREDQEGNGILCTLNAFFDPAYRRFVFKNHEALKSILSSKVQDLSDLMKSNDLENRCAAIEQELIEITRLVKEAWEKNTHDHEVTFDRKIKLLFTGLENSGKTAFALSLMKRFSLIPELQPTRGLDIRKIGTILGATIVAWDMGGQKIYRDRYSQQEDLYISNADAVFFFSDSSDPSNIEESLAYFKNLISIIAKMSLRIPIIVVFTKCDPDTEETCKECGLTLERAMRDVVAREASALPVKFFYTTIFDKWSILRAYSMGLSLLSPNRELLEAKLASISKELASNAIILFDSQGVVLGMHNPGGDAHDNQVLEFSAPRFKVIHDLFYKAKLLKKDAKQEHVIYNMTGDKSIIFQEITKEGIEINVLVVLDEKNLMEEHKYVEIMERFNEHLDALMDLHLG